MPIKLHHSFFYDLQNARLSLTFKQYSFTKFGFLYEFCGCLPKLISMSCCLFCIYTQPVNSKFIRKHTYSKFKHSFSGIGAMHDERYFLFRGRGDTIYIQSLDKQLTVSSSINWFLNVFSTKKTYHLIGFILYFDNPYFPYIRNTYEEINMGCATPF